jgi:hypothetical protein
MCAIPPSFLTAARPGRNRMFSAFAVDPESFVARFSVIPRLS